MQCYQNCHSCPIEAVCLCYLFIFPWPCPRHPLSLALPQWGTGPSSFQVLASNTTASSCSSHHSFLEAVPCLWTGLGTLCSLRASQGRPMVFLMLFLAQSDGFLLPTALLSSSRHSFASNLWGCAKPFVNLSRSQCCSSKDKFRTCPEPCRAF